MKPEGGRPRRHEERAPRILQMFGYLAVTFSLLLKKATHNNRKQHKATIDSNRKQHHNKSVKWSMGHPVALDILNEWFFILSPAAFGGDENRFTPCILIFISPTHRRNSGVSLKEKGEFAMKTCFQIDEADCGLLLCDWFKPRKGQCELCRTILQKNI